MTPKDIQLVKDSWTEIGHIDPVIAGGMFYKRLFETAPHFRQLFREPLPLQSKKLMVMLGYIIYRLDKTDTLLNDIRQLAYRHVQYGVKEEHYGMVGAALLWTLEQALQSKWNDEVKEGWIACYEFLSAAMIDASAASLHRA